MAVRGKYFPVYLMIDGVDCQTLSESWKACIREGEAPAEPRFSSVSARQEPRPPSFEIRF